MVLDSNRQQEIEYKDFCSSFFFGVWTTIVFGVRSLSVIVSVERAYIVPLL